MKDSKPLKLFLWLFGILFALLPIAAVYVNGRIDGNPPGWIDLLSGGELFLISSAVAADAVFKALHGGVKFRGPRIFVGACCLLAVAATSIYFGRIAYSEYLHQQLLESAIRAQNLKLALHQINYPGMDRTVVAEHSLWLFGFSLICALGVIMVEED
jgi:hypothetical protein